MMGYSHLHEAPDLLAPHYHHNMEFVVLIQGRQQYMVGDSIYTLHGGDIFMSFPNEVHGNDRLSREIYEYIWFQLDYSSSENFLGLTPPYSDYLYRQLSHYQTRITHTSQKNLHTLRRAFQLLSSGDIHSHLSGYSLFLEFITDNFCEDSTPVTEEDSHIDLTAATNYIHSHLTENPTLESISGQCGMSPARFHTIFKEQMGITPHAYIMNLKIDTAKILLKDPSNTITNVAFQLNFSSSNHFSSVFRKYTGFTPTQYRKNKCPNIF